MCVKDVKNINMCKQSSYALIQNTLMPLQFIRKIAYIV